MNEATSRKLEFDEVRETLAMYCGTSVGKRLARTITPATKARIVREWLGQVHELIALEEEYSPPPMGGVHDIREFVRASAFPAPLEPEALADIAETLNATAPLRAWFARIGDKAPLLQTLGERILDLSWLGTSIYEAIDPRGEVRDYASPKLAALRNSIKEGRGRIRGVFDRITRQASLTRMLQYASVTFHNDRMVLPLKAEYRGRIPGIIHRSSDSGSTLFVEPAESVELNNLIVRLREDENKEVTRILREFSQLVRDHTQAILSTLRVIGIVDLIGAKFRYAKKRSCVCPEINTDGVLDLHEARHPILIELFDAECHEGDKQREVVPIDVRLGDDFDILVITGPNTGGKTVTLKTIGLLAMMTQCGIPIPAGEGSTMPIYSDVYFDVGDEQSLQQSLSTFSSHLSTLLEILRNSEARSLVLIDELGAGTDPDEGAAIGRTIVAELLRLKATAIVTTHLSVLKALAYTIKRVDNAAVEFDPESLKPTFHLRLGEPGNSNALIIAKRLGMPARMVKFAKDCLSDNTRALNRAIAGTLGSRREAERARKVAREAQLEAQRERQRCEQNRVELERSRAAFEQWTQWVNTLEPGDDVFARTLNGPAKIVRMQLHKQRAVVSTGAMDIEVPLRDIQPPQNRQD
ncbi:MAG: endonuclease MutS2 [Planctomycetota bacterium]|jgi:DNA mismatch repair protein MutS2